MKLHQTKEEWAEDLRDCSFRYIEIHSVYALEDIATLFAEVERLNKCLRYEQHRAGRQGTHWDGCHTGGPEHYECALRRIAELESMLEEIAATDPVVGGSAHD